MFVACAIFLLFLVHPTITREAFGALACTQLGGDKTFLLSDLSLQCWKDEHLVTVLSLTLPTVILWVVGIPVLGLAMILRGRKRLQQRCKRTWLKLGFLVKGYKPRYFYWETVVFGRKVLLGAVVALYGHREDVRNLLAMAVLCVALVLHVAVSPLLMFRDVSFFDFLEGCSLTTTFALFFLGSFTRLQNVSDGEIVAASVLAAAGNVAFFLAILVTAYLIRVRGKKLVHTKTSSAEDNIWDKCDAQEAPSPSDVVSRELEDAIELVQLS